MSESFMDLLENIPARLLRAQPANAILDQKLHEKIDKLAGALPDTLSDIGKALDKIRSFREYDAAANRAAAHVWLVRERFFTAEEPALRSALLSFAVEHMAEEALARICRRLVKDADQGVRRAAQRLVHRGRIREVALPLDAEGDWDATGWLRGATEAPLSRHKQGRRILEARRLPVIANLKQLRELLLIKSPRQLGYLLLATDANDGPYTSFEIAKRDGGARKICAPKKQLRWVQRHILDKILARVPAHDAAHGFVPGRSTVTNATPHLGAELLLKFDLTEFFPTIHYYRVLGLFTSLGYHAPDARFSSDDESKRVAGTLTRLCCYTADPEEWSGAIMPQGAPTSPALSNLVCRRLDARLTGLAQRNKGVYTRYADDLTFSFKKAKDIDLGRFRWWVDQICHQEGFLINQKKFRVVRDSQRQLVTGIVVNEQLRIPREERRRFRAMLHNCRKHGIESQARGRSDFASYLRGFASYVNMVDPEEGAELLKQVAELLGPDEEPEET
jgi:retron-type reverse transcriptase